MNAGLGSWPFPEEPEPWWWEATRLPEGMTAAYDSGSGCYTLTLRRCGVITAFRLAFRRVPASALPSLMSTAIRQVEAEHLREAHSRLRTVVEWDVGSHHALEFYAG